MESFTSQNTTMYHSDLANADAPVFLWAHGWGQNHKSFDGLVQSLQNDARHIAIDFPGFGQSPKPDGDWSTEEYADFIAEFIRTQNLPPIVWVGHSFGGRVGVQMAAKYPDIVDSMFIIAGAGLKRKRGPLKRLWIKLRIYTFKTLKFLTKFGFSRNWLAKKFGSSDYANAGDMKTIFIKVVNEDLTDQAQKVSCPTFLFYGEHDNETPPEFGLRFEELMQNAECIILDGQDHYSVLSSGRHMIASHMKRYIKEMKHQENQERQA